MYFCLFALGDARLRNTPTIGECYMAETYSKSGEKTGGFSDVGDDSSQPALHSVKDAGS